MWEDGLILDKGQHNKREGRPARENQKNEMIGKEMLEIEDWREKRRSRPGRRGHPVLLILQRTGHE
jgi:hypothetical protein